LAKDPVPERWNENAVFDIAENAGLCAARRLASAPPGDRDLSGAAGAILSSLEESFPALQSAVPRGLFPSNTDAQSAQTILASIAT
jgi:hypothetical protein